MKSTVRRVAAPLTALVLTAALAACGDSGGSGSEKQAVTLWMYPVIADQAASTAYWEKVEKDFEAANTDVDLKLEMQPWDKRDEKLATAFAGRKGPDVVLQIPDQLPQYVKNGSLEPIDDVVEADKAKFLPNSIPGLTVDGKVYAAPIYQTVTTTIYNKTVLTKAGIAKPPATWDEIKAAAPKIKAAGFSTLDYSASPETTLNLNFYPLLWQAGGKVFADDGKTVAFNQPPGVEALTFLKTLFDEGAIPKSALTNANAIDNQPLGKGTVAMAFTATPANAATAAKTWGAGNLEVGTPLTGAKQVGYGIPGGLAVNAASENVGAAKKFVSFMIQPAQMQALSKATGYFTPRTDATAEIADPTAQKFADSLQYAFPGEPNTAARQVMSLLAVEIQAVLTGKKAPQQALDDAAKQANALLGR
ncbi:sugar ABC transporter substrate-binding protein [Kribbella sandramycini]|uniref:Multiple sugar transport system substrate-binding protein n=1 Tax=Kribbella sandramycini TaxID=60450 RepID=A0A7Y4L539_9ACTN|nr:sugar ABC transporter substrate-binding protein [Kribbella sandramycini]MBB6566790.1 multiple sugar transport system substrate-binding protein [Kribbella sandramycini]NOL44513.1 sugar ABC transporter substrate-binding protein [Kribbella sandramycini]